MSTLGAALLAVAVFLPWYGVSITPAGIAAAQQSLQEVAQTYGNALLQSQVSGLAPHLTGVAGHEISSLSAHQALHVLNVVLLVIAALALLDALLPLLGTAAPLPEGAGGAVVLLGTLAALLVGYRMADPPTPGGELLALSLREGCWLALLGALMIALGGMRPRMRVAAGLDEDAVMSSWGALSGWTPGEQP